MALFSGSHPATLFLLLTSTNSETSKNLSINPSNALHLYKCLPYATHLNKPEAHHLPKAATTYRVGSVRAVASSAYGSFLFGAGLAAMYGSLWLGLRLVAAGDLSIGTCNATIVLRRCCQRRAL